MADLTAEGKIQYDGEYAGRILRARAVPELLA